MKQTLTIIIYRALDWLKQESPFWWAIVQSILWASFGLISTSWVDFKGEEVVLLFIGGLISGVGTRTTKKLSETQSPVSVNPDKFKEGFNNKLKEIEDSRVELDKEVPIVKEFLPNSQYVNEITFKDTIVLHHTAGGNYKGTIAHWLSKPDRVATHFIIDRDGTIVQTIPIECWAFHLGVSARDNKVSREFRKNTEKLDKKCISIELCSYGQLIKKGDKFFNIYNKEVPKEQVDTLTYSFRGYDYYEKYTEEQLRSLKKLLEQLLKEHPHIPLQKDYSNIFDINQDALSGKPGIFTHVSYRTNGKWDCYPNPDLIQMLNNLKSNL